MPFTCPICLQDFQAGDQAVTHIDVNTGDAANHDAYHEDCFRKAVDTYQNRCPQCTQAVDLDDLVAVEIS